MKETETREFKRSLAELKAGLVSVTAILNKHGKGELWFGIRNDGTAVGLDVTEKTLRDVSQSIASHIEPCIYPKITHETIDGANCIKIAFEGQEAPYFAYGRTYMRVADEDRQLAVKDLEKLILSRNSEKLRWDNQECSVSITDLDESKLERFVKRAGLEWDTPGNTLEKLGLLKAGKLVNAARLFFAAAAPMQLRCAVFATMDSATIIDRHDFDGDILELIEEAQKYILKNIHIGMRLDGLYRKDVPEISVDAIREAIINAFCHRDYRDPDYVQIAIFKDRVEIRNPGALIGGLTIEAIRSGCISKRRNPLICEMCRRIEMVEAWGRGMPLIMENEPGVEFKEIADIFIVSFSRPSFAQDAEGGSGKSSEKRRENVGKTSGKILEACHEKSSITIPELSALTGVTERSIERNIQKLQADGFLKRIGGRKAGHWEVVEESK